VSERQCFTPGSLFLLLDPPPLEMRVCGSRCSRMDRVDGGEAAFFKLHDTSLTFKSALLLSLSFSQEMR
jgi:hypothetical protein